MITSKPISFVTKGDPLHVGQDLQRNGHIFQTGPEQCRARQFRQTHALPTSLAQDGENINNDESRPCAGEEPGAGGRGPRQGVAHPSRLRVWVSGSSGSARSEWWPEAPPPLLPAHLLCCCDWVEDGAGRMEILMSLQIHLHWWYHRCHCFDI